MWGDTRSGIASAELTSDVVTEDPAGDDVAAGGKQSLQVRLQATQSPLYTTVQKRTWARCFGSPDT